MSEPEAFDRILLAQQDLLGRLQQMLQTELEALLAGDVEHLHGLAAGKMDVFAELRALEQQRLERAGQRSAAMAVGEADRMRKVQELGRAVVQANQRNGLIVSALIRNTQGALDILRGIGADNAAGVYGPAGHALATQQAAKPLGSA
ncbi:MAG: flagellar protein FlgN [Betaproteobacteria bacterium]|nr:flagellar protein FlgN [Betaproteobacteria bacterium]